MTTDLEPQDDTGTVAVGEASDSARSGRDRRRSASAQKWTRLIHVYTSMIAMLVVLFFGATGLTLNHPDWTLGFETTTSNVRGTLPKGSVTADGQPEYLTISEYLRDTEHVRGSVADFGSTGTAGYISYHGPGYAADFEFDTDAGTYTGKVEQQGLVGVLNDLHKGRSTNASWGWVIDLAAGFLVVISLTGIGLQLFLRRRRRSAIIVASVGAIVTAVLAILTIR